MHLLLNQQLAHYHRGELQREAELARLASLVGQQVPVDDSNRLLVFLSHMLNGTRVLFRRPVVMPKPVYDEVPLTEIKPALEATFSVMREVGLISDYDDNFIEQFNNAFERELVHQAECRC